MLSPVLLYQGWMNFNSSWGLEYPCKDTLYKLLALGHLGHLIIKWLHVWPVTLSDHWKWQKTMYVNESRAWARARVKHSFMYLSSFFLFVGDRVSLCSLGYPGTHSVDQAGLELRDSPASASWALGLKMCFFIVIFDSTILFKNYFIYLKKA